MRILRSNILKESIKEKLLTIYSFCLNFFPQLILTSRSWNIAKIELMIIGLYLCVWKPCDVSLVILHISKWNRKQKLLKIVGFFLDFFSLVISTTISQNMASIHLIQMGLFFSKMVVEIAFLDLQTSPISQIVCLSSDKNIKFGANWKSNFFIL